MFERESRRHQARELHNQLHIADFFALVVLAVQMAIKGLERDDVPGKLADRLLQAAARLFAKAVSRMRVKSLQRCAWDHVPSPMIFMPRVAANSANGP